MTYTEAFLEAAALLEGKIDSESTNNVEELFQWLNKTDNEELDQQCLFVKSMLLAADLYARSKWNEACEATRASLTSDNPIKPEFKP